jgi:hypothetical protein
MAALYADEDFPRPVLAILRRLGHDVLTPLDRGQANRKAPDEAHLKFAAEAGRIVLTHNRSDFIRLHRRDRRHAGIIVCKSKMEVGREAELIDRALARHDLAGRLVRVGPGGFRVDEA